MPVTRLFCGVTANGNAVAFDADNPSFRHLLIAKSGEYRNCTDVQFPPWVAADEVTGEESPEQLLRKYFGDFNAKKLAAEQAEAEREQAASEEIKLRWGSFHCALAALNEARRKQFWIEPTVKKLRAALKSAEKRQAREKEEVAWMKRCLRAAATLSKRPPKLPLKGKGHARADFPYDGHNRKLAALYAAIPNTHKDSVAYRRWGGCFSSVCVISPEAAKKIAALMKEAVAE